MTVLAATDIHFAYASTPVLHGVSLELHPGSLTAIVGPNGCGKSTLLRILAGLSTPTRGKVTIDSTPISTLKPRKRARLLGFLPQSPLLPPGVRVRELVALGRAPHLSHFARPSRADRGVIDSAIDACDVAAFADREVASLSGGERQRAWLAMVLAQEPSVLLLDEPTSALDIGHQLSTLALVRRLSRERSLSVGVVLHDLDLAVQASDTICALKDGLVRTSGPSAEVLTPDVCHDLFGVRPDPCDPAAPRCRFSMPAS